MAGGKPQLFVKAQGIGPGLVGGQLDEAATRCPRALDGLAEQRLADALSAMRSGDAHAFDLGAAHAGAAETVDNGKLQATGDRTADLGKQINIARLGGHPVEGVAVGRGQRVDRLFAALPQPVVCQHPHDRRQVAAFGHAKGEGVGCWFPVRHAVSIAEKFGSIWH